MIHNRRRLAWPLLSLVLLLSLLSSLASAQQPQTQAQINPDVFVNGQALERSAVIGSTGQDLAVKATPLLRATGASVEFDGNKLDASWSESILTLHVGRSHCIYNGQEIKLEAPAGLYENDLVVQLDDLCRIIKASVTKKGQQIAVQTANFNSSNVTNQNNQLATAPLPALNGRVSAKNAYLANIQNGGNIFGMPPLEAMPNTNGNYSSSVSLPDSMENPAFPEAGMGGLTTKNAKSSPYERPLVSATNVGDRQITTETPRSVDDIASMANSPGIRYPSGLSQMSSMSAGMSAADFNMSHPSNNQQPQPATISYSAVPSGRTAYNYPTTANPKEKRPEPAKPEIIAFDVLRQMSFYATAYEIKATIRNTGELAVQKPFMVKFMVKSHKRNSQWDVVESYLINPLEPGQQVDISKRVDGHQYACLLDLSIDFKVSVVEEVPIPTTGINGRNWTRAKNRNNRNQEKEPTYSQTMTRAKETSYQEKNVHF